MGCGASAKKYGAPKYGAPDSAAGLHLKRDPSATVVSSHDKADTPHAAPGPLVLRLARDDSVTPTSSPGATPRGDPSRASHAGSRKLRACKYGSGCYQRNTDHLSKFAHPGDRNYRIGQVSFGPGQTPDLQTIWQIFNFYDYDESGYLRKDDFKPLFEFMVGLVGQALEMTEFDTCWDEINQNHHLNFSRLVVWSQKLQVALPIGVNDVNESRPCRFKATKRGEHEQERCSCPNYEAAEDGFLCRCGHKPSMHRSDNAEASASDAKNAPSWWAEGKQDLVEVQDEGIISQLQTFLDETHKTTDNWTRDRGCKIHGRHHPDCSFGCAFRNQVPVPTKYVVKKVLRNQNLDLWTKYSMMRSSIADECAKDSGSEYSDVEVASKADLDTPLVDGCNEWRLLHGTNINACRGICSSNFRLSLAGTGATWKDPGSEKGSPLYGFGIYLAERVTKADEYSECVGHDALCSMLGYESGSSLSEEVFCLLVIRCVGGKTNVVTTNDIDKDKLKSDVFDGPHHSVFGDRVVSLGKPYKEIVVYDKDQCYPEFLILYERGYDSASDS